METIHRGDKLRSSEELFKIMVKPPTNSLTYIAEDSNSEDLASKFYEPKLVKSKPPPQLRTKEQNISSKIELTLFIFLNRQWSGL